MNNLYQGIKALPIKISDELISKNIVKAIKDYYESTAENANIYAKHKAEYDEYLDKHTIVEVDREVGIVTAYVEKEVLDLDGDEPWDFTVIDINQARRFDTSIECGTEDEPNYCPVEFDLSLVEEQAIAIMQHSCSNMVNYSINNIKNSRQNSGVRFTTYSIDQDPSVKTDNKVLRELFNAIEVLKAEVNISDDVVIEKLKEAIFKTVKKYYEHDVNNRTVYFKNKDSYDEYMKNHVKININVKDQTFDVFLEKEVVDLNGATPWGDFTVIDVNEANRINRARCGMGARTIVCGNDENPVFFPVKLNVSKLGRTAVNQAKQSLRGEIKNILKERIIEKFEHLEHSCITTTVLRIEQSQRRNDRNGDDYNVVLSYNDSELTLYKNEQIPGEVFAPGDTVKVYVLEIVNKEKSNPYVKITRTHWDFIRKLFEENVPEIGAGIIEIKEIAREAGSRTKVAVVSNNSNIDAVGACIGKDNSRISSICKELGYRENIDIVNYSPDIATFVANALAPAKITGVQLTTENVIDKKTGKSKEQTICRVTVPEEQISLAIGNKGQNARLAANLTKCKIDIKPAKKNVNAETPKKGE
jgi:N utilization substance protein A